MKDKLEAVFNPCGKLSQFFYKFLQKLGYLSKEIRREYRFTVLDGSSQIRMQLLIILFNITHTLAEIV